MNGRRFDAEWLIRNHTSATSGAWPRCLNLAQPSVVVLSVMFPIGCMQSRVTSLVERDKKKARSGIVPVFHGDSLHVHTFRRAKAEGKRKEKGIRADFPFFMECNSMIRTFYAFLHLSPGPRPSGPIIIPDRFLHLFHGLLWTAIERPTPGFPAADRRKLRKLPSLGSTAI